MGVEFGSNNQEIQDREVQLARERQIEQNEAEHRRLGEVLDNKSTIDNEGERKLVSPEAESDRLKEDTSKLDNNSSIEDDDFQEQTAMQEKENAEKHPLETNNSICYDNGGSMNLSSAEASNDSPENVRPKFDGENLAEKAEKADDSIEVTANTQTNVEHRDIDCSHNRQETSNNQVKKTIEVTDEKSDNTFNIYDGSVKNDTITKDRSFADKVKDAVLGKESAYDAEKYDKRGIKGVFDELPRDRREAVYEKFENAPVEIKRTVNDLSDKLLVEKAAGDDVCHYDIDAKKIRMESNMTDAEYSEIFCHEYGHFVDNQKGDVSSTYEFKDAISKDLANYDRSTEVGKQNFDTMLNSLMNSDSAYDMAISDNMSAFFENDPEVMQRYRDENIDYYQHSND